MKHALTASILLALVALLSVAFANGQEKTPAIGDVVVYHLGDVDRPALVVDPVGPVLHVFLAPEDREPLQRECWRLAHPEDAKLASEPAARCCLRGKRPLAAADMAHVADTLSLTVTADAGDWSSR